MGAEEEMSNIDFNTDVGYTIPDPEELGNLDKVNIGRPGPLGIILQAHKLLSTHRKFFLLILLTLMLPLSILAVAGACLFNTVIVEPPSPDQNGGNYTELFGGNNYNLLVIVIMLLVSIFANIVAEAATSLASSAILYAVGLHYTDRSVSFHDVLSVTIPRLWLRLTCTNVYKIVLLGSFGIGYTVVCGAIVIIFRRQSIWSVWLGTFLIAQAIGSYWLDIIFMVAASVSVLEKDYWRAAVKRSLQLLRGRKATAFLFLLVWLVPTIISGVMFYLIQLTYLSPVTLLLLVVYTCWITYLWLLKSVCTGVQYVSFKAYHNEDLATPMSEKETALKYANSVIADAEVGGQQGNDCPPIPSSRGGHTNKVHPMLP